MYTVEIICYVIGAFFVAIVAGGLLGSYIFYRGEMHASAEIKKYFEELEKRERLQETNLQH